MTPAGLGRSESCPCSVGDGVALCLLLRVNTLELVALEKALLLDYGAEGCINSS